MREFRNSRFEKHLEEILEAAAGLKIQLRRLDALVREDRAARDYINARFREFNEIARHLRLLDLEVEGDGH